MYTNPDTGKGWTPEEEQTISRLMLEYGCTRADAIRKARAKWLIGETRPALWPTGRPKPDTSAEPKQQTPLLHRKYATVTERFASRRESTAQRVKRLRQSKLHLPPTQNQQLRSVTFCAESLPEA